ncbi:hypothetical protein GCM10010359_39560 [Streptomyces morookaense]|nr:hypothetical protein GCM10010359_39560 [Streptomyces morookaense]
MGALLGGVPGPADDGFRVSGEVADGGVDLVQGETKLSHGPSVFVYVTQWGCEGAHAVPTPCLRPGPLLATRRDLVAGCAPARGA